MKLVSYILNIRNILGITWKDKITNAEVLRRTGSNTLFYILTQRRLRWLGHVRRMPCGRLPKDILYGELATGRRDLGRPKLRFKDVIKRDLRTAVIHARAQCENQYTERLALQSRKRKNPPQDSFQGLFRPR